MPYLLPGSCYECVMGKTIRQASSQHELEGRHWTGIARTTKGCWAGRNLGTASEAPFCPGSGKG
jgi:hypothetical protein